MFSRFAFFFSSILVPAIPSSSTTSEETPCPIHNSSLSDIDTEAEETLDLSQEAFFSEEEELSAAPRHRPQVVQIPKKISNAK